LFTAKAGWAHSVLFTADLRSFSDRTPDGSPASTPKKKRKIKEGKAIAVEEAGPVSDEVESPVKAEEPA
jgi:hypothetical protein